MLLDVTSSTLQAAELSPLFQTFYNVFTGQGVNATPGSDSPPEGSSGPLLSPPPNSDLLGNISGNVYNVLNSSAFAALSDVQQNQLSNLVQAGSLSDLSSFSVAGINVTTALNSIRLVCKGIVFNSPVERIEGCSRPVCNSFAALTNSTNFLGSSSLGSTLAPGL